MKISIPDHIRILAVDDDQSMLNIYQHVFSLMQPSHDTAPNQGELPGVSFTDQLPVFSQPRFELVTCSQGEEAVAMVKTAIETGHPFAVVFMDVRLPPGPDGIWAAEQIRILDANVEIVIVTGYSDLEPTHIMPRIPPIHKLLYLEKPFLFKEITQCALALGIRWQTERELRKVQEQLERWIDERTAEVMQATDRLQEEFEERKQVEEALRKSEERYRVVLESVPDPVIVYDTEGKVTYVNPAFSRIFGWSAYECIGQELDFVPVEHLPDARLIWTKIHRGQTVSGVETHRITKRGERVDVSVSGAGFFDSQGTLQGSVLSLQDITERKKTEEEIRFIAYHDTLTGLPNRKSFYMRLEDKLLQSRSQAGDMRRAVLHKWAVLFLDLDRFKYVNDTLGHDAGDELLKLVAERLQQCVRESDYVFRLGGDEFMVILNDLVNDTDVVKVAQKMGRHVAQPCYIEGHELYPNISIGISLYPDDGENVERLVKNADMAMYAAKEGGEGYRFFTEEMNKKALERMMLESSLRNALQSEQFCLYYQPLVDNARNIIGMEALLRWHHPELGLISPSKFIPLAEETGAIVLIGKWVLHSACVQVKRWHDMGHSWIQVAVNLSTRQFREPDLVQTVEQVLEVTGIPPACLQLEVTESGIMEQPEQAIATMKRLREKGVQFSIDDFGTGYSSLGYLKRFPIDTLKIDRSFVMEATTNTDDQEIIKTIISMAQHLNLSTVAEGVETKEQQDFLAHNGCHLMQGYYFGRPMPAEQFEKLLFEK